MARRNVRHRRPSVNQDPFARLSQRTAAEDDDPFARLTQDEPRRVRLASPSISEIEHRESYDAIRKRNLLGSLDDQEAIERAENPDLLDRFGETLKETVTHPLRTAGGLVTGTVKPVMDAISPSKEAAARANRPNSTERMMLSAKVGTPAMSEAAPFGAGVTGAERAGGIAGTLALGIAPGVAASLPKFLGASALAGAASAPDDPLLGAAMGSTVGALARPFRKVPAAVPEPAPVTGFPSLTPAPRTPLDRYRTMRFGLRDADPSVDIALSTTGAPVRRPKPKTANAPGTPAAEAAPFSTTSATVRRRPAGEPNAAPNPFDDLALKEAEAAPAVTPPPDAKIAAAAMRSGGRVGRGTDHPHALIDLARELGFRAPDDRPPTIEHFELAERYLAERGHLGPSVEQGFLTQGNEFLSRDQAAKLPIGNRKAISRPSDVGRLAEDYEMGQAGTPAAESVPFAMGGPESRIPEIPKGSRQAREKLAGPVGAFPEAPGEGPAPAPTTTARGQFHAEARTPGGRLRPFTGVDDDGLIRELESIGAKMGDARRRAEYRSIGENDAMNFQAFAATRHGKGPSQQAKALQNLEDYTRITKAIDAELKRRGHTDESITQRLSELSTLDEAIAREREQHMDETDTSFFGFGEDAPIPPLKTATPDAPAASVLEPDRSAEYPAGTPREWDPKTLTNAVKRTGLTDESAATARQQLLDSGHKSVRVTFDDQRKVAAQLAGTLGVEVSALRPDVALRMSIPDMYARITKASTNVKLIEALSKEVTTGTLSPDEAVNLSSAIDRLEGENRTLYGDVLVAGSQKGRELGAMRMIARMSTDPAVWEVQAMRKLGGKPLSDQVRGTVRRMAKEVAEACGI